MLYTLWRINDAEQKATSVADGTAEAMRQAAATAEREPGWRYEVLSAGGAPFDAVSEPTGCGCYSCGGECGGSQAPGACGPLADVAGRQVCEACRNAADVFANDDSRRLGLRAVTDGERVTVTAGVFGHHPKFLNFSPAMARLFAARLTELADQAEDGE